MKKLNHKVFVAASAFLLSMSIFPQTGFAADQAVITKGVYAQGIDLSGMTSDQAKTAIDSYFQTIADSSFTITCMDGETETVPISDWEFTWDSDSVVEKAMSLGHCGGLLKEYKDQVDLAIGNIYLDVPYSVDSKQIESSLKKISRSHDDFAKNASIKRSDGKFVVDSEGENGTVTDKEATAQLIVDQLTDHLSDSMSVEVITRTDTPNVTADDLLVIKDELGSFTTDYSSSKKGRKQNIKTATNYLNGTILMPGESLSVSTAIKDRTEANGYATSMQYVNGESEEDIGGGVCQVSTTLYNALLRAELKVTERHNHSMVVNYVPYGMDAAIAQGSKDLIFVNNLENPIYLYGSANGEYLTYKIYGVEYRDPNREVTYKSVTEEEVYNNEKKVAYSSKIKSGKSETTGTVHPKVTAAVYKIVTVDGKEVSREMIHRDYYRDSQRTITYGTG